MRTMDEILVDTKNAKNFEEAFDFAVEALGLLHNVIGDISIERLREICDAEKTKKCVTIPFEVGTRFWSTEILKTDICEIEVVAFTVDPNMENPIWSVFASACNEACSYEFILSDIGETVFTTEEKAKEMWNKNEIK